MGRPKKVQEEVQANAKELESVFANIEKKYGKGSIMQLGEDSASNIDVIPSGSMTLDMATGIGGFPRGKIVEIYGDASSGKTTTALSLIRSSQEMGLRAALIDAEQAFDINYAKKLKINISTLTLCQNNVTEEALDIVQQLVESKKYGVIVIDSVAALVPKSELDGSIGDSHMGLQARLMSQALRMINQSIGESNTCVIFINQTRLKIGVVFGSPKTTTGGEALKFYASMRIEVAKRDTVKDSSGNAIGIVTKASIKKNKLAAPFKIAEFGIYFTEGLSPYADVLTIAIDYGIIEKKGSWYSYNKEQIGQGEAQVIEKLKTDVEFFNKLKAEAINFINSNEEEKE